MPGLDPAGYPPALAELLRASPLAPLDPGTPDRSLRGQLEALDDAAFGGRVERGLADACRAGLWLAFNFLDESHTISQGLHTAEGSYWHALMHRREPDFDNSKYWFRRVGTHPVFGPLRAAAAGLAAESGPAAAFLTTQKAWDPYAFVDLCEESLAGRSPCALVCREVQRREWELLFEYCYRGAVGRKAED
jgi:hypothetical protein